ncbi:hypothetical protein ACXR2U_00920 [Jatrophihabitans sp. YIM 134969]
MNAPDTTQPSPRQLLADAVQALTAAARLDHGPDFAEFVTLAVASAVANIGDIETALARRPGSWEAAHVRDMLVSTVGDDLSVLFHHRTEPLHFVVRPEQLLFDEGYWRLHDEDEATLERRYDALALPSMTHHPDGTLTGDPTPWTPEQEAAAATLDELTVQLHKLQDDDIAAYGGSYAAAVRAAVVQLLPGLSVPVEVTVESGFDDDPGAHIDAMWAVVEKARGDAPVPSSGIPLRDYPAGADLADVERRANRSPLQRIGQLSPPPAP